MEERRRWWGWGKRRFLAQAAAAAWRCVMRRLGRPGDPTLQLGRHRLTTRRADPGDAGAADRSRAACVEEREGVTGYNTRVR